MLIPIVLTYYLNSLLIKFLLFIIVIKSGGPKYILISTSVIRSYMCLALIFYSYLLV